MYRDGKVVHQDYAEAVRWFRKAAGHGDLDAAFDLGVMYEEGQGRATIRRRPVGIARRPSKALRRPSTNWALAMPPAAAWNRTTWRRTFAWTWPPFAHGAHCASDIPQSGMAWQAS